MRKSLWIIPILFLALGALHAHADTVVTYDINFTCTSGSSCILPTSGTFTYDETDHTFSNFEVVWDGSSINLESVANAGPFVQGADSCLGSATGGAATYLLMTACPFNTYEPWLAPSGGTFAFTESLNGTDYSSIRAGSLSSNDTQSWGDFTLTETPEPGTFVLMLTGIGLVLVMRKRIGHTNLFKGLQDERPVQIR
jgi:hypothetical protein